MTAPDPKPPDLAALSPWATELARTFVSLSSDIALVIDDEGIIRNVALGHADPISSSAHLWVGRPWIDTVSGETRPKIENLLKEVTATGIARRREVNHPLGAETSIPVAYTAVRLGQNGPVLAVGRDLRTIAAIQQRYVDSQQDMERGYWQARQAEARYQTLFQVATDAVIVVDGATLLIVEANQAATALLAASATELAGRPVSSAFEHHSRGPVDELVRSARTTGQSGEIRARLLGTQASTSVLATPFRADHEMRLLVRMRPLEIAGASTSLNQNIARLVDDSTDGVVVTDSSGRILIANPAFIALAHLPAEAQARSQPLMNWLGLADQSLASLIAEVRTKGIARSVTSWIKRGPPPGIEVETSAALLTEGDQECIGYTIHPVARGPQLALDTAATDALTLVFRAGLTALGTRLSDDAIAGVVRDAAAMLGLSPERLTPPTHRSSMDKSAP